MASRARAERQARRGRAARLARKAHRAHQGAQGIQGVQGSPGLTGVEDVIEVGVPGEGSATATCPAGKYVIGGGATTSSGWFYRSEPTDNASWTASADGGATDANVTAFAICANLSAPPVEAALMSSAALSARPK